MKVYRHLLTTTGFGAILAAAQDRPNAPKNPSVDLSSCQALSCNPPNGSICSLGDMPGPEIGVGIAANAVNASGTNISFTLIDGLDENGFTGMASEEYEFSDQQLFVGIDTDNDYPSGCALMMQYQGQTFPTERFPGEDDAREVQYQNTTSCDGVLDVFCQSAIVNMIRSFNASDAAEGGSRCRQLVQQVNMKLQNDSSTCGSEGSWIANFINVTGGALPGPDTSSARNDRLGNRECRPVLPQQYQLYKVAVMRQFYFADPPEPDSDFYGRVFGGRAGFTPIITVVYEGGTNSTRPDVQFSCMQTFERDGHSREDVFNSGATARWRVGSFLLTVLLPIGLVYAF